MHKHSSCGRLPLHINVDETSVKLLPEPGVGYLAEKARIMKRSPRSLVYSTPRGNTRAAFSYVCMVTDDAEIQQILPQLLLVNKKVVSVKDMATIRDILPPNIHVWHGESSWTTTSRMKAVIKLLIDSLAGKLENRQVFLTADCFRAHITQPVWRACKTHRIFYSLVPSKMTWALQPCDTHVFASFKRHLQQKCHESMLAQPDGALTTIGVFKAVVASISEIVCSRSWEKAFADTGLVGNQSTVSARVLQKLGFSQVPLVGNDLPTLAMLQSVFPKNTVIPVMLVFGCFLDDHEVTVDAPTIRERIVTRSISRGIAAPAGASSAVPSTPEISAWTLAAAPLPHPTRPLHLLRLPSRSRLPSSLPQAAKRTRNPSLPASSV